MPAIRRRSLGSKRALMTKRGTAKKRSMSTRTGIAKKRIIVKKRVIAKKPSTAAKRAAMKKRMMTRKRIIAKKPRMKKEYFTDSKTLTPMAMVFIKFKKNAPFKTMQTYLKNKIIHEAWSWSGEWDYGLLFDVRKSSELRDIMNKTIRKSNYIAKFRTKWIEKCW